MQNLKIRVNSADESKEAQELFFELGYEWHGSGKSVSYLESVASDEFGYLVAWKPGCFSKYIIQMGCGKEDAKEITLPELRAMVNQDQDEPFLTPECTLNDQYAEIEQVRQIEIHGTVKAEPDFNFGAAQASGGVDATLSQRQSQYGCYEDVAHVTQQILSALRVGNYDELPAPMKESLHMIASKMARIVNGDPEYLDNWHDIGGYAKLIEKLIEGE